ncbi:hypothetical protein KUTeg_002992 [Tegillarca granosa]|uniref:Uncharacterized protein n=1 Tax=Tegillarca granosa TaxID=220873 RepID=A0ABQ9FKT9_TEGGR|nr:hypothetical protein KUTeg_002992 [Tegillarca granosa]
MERNFSYSFERGETIRFSSYDYVVWGLTLAVSAGIGLYYAIVDRKKNDTEEFLLGGRKLKILPVSLSLLSSFISAITILGTPAEIYLFDTMFWWISVGFIISAIGAAHIFIPVFHRLQITSTFEELDIFQVTGLDLWGSIVAVGLVCTFYTTLILSCLHEHY